MPQNDPPVLLTTRFLHCADTFPRVPGGASEYFDINLSLGSLVLLKQGGHVLWVTKSIHACSLLSLESRWGFQFTTINPLLLQKLYNASGRKGFSGGTNGKESICQCRRHNRQVPSLGGKDPLEESMTTHSSILAWRIPQTDEPSRLQSVGSHRVGPNWSNLACRHVRLGEKERSKKQYKWSHPVLPTLGFLSTPVVPRRRQWHPTPVHLLGKSHGRRSLLGCNPWGR